MNNLEKIKQHIKQSKYFCSGDTIIIGVSGGIDSVCLLYILNSLKHNLGIRLIVGHFNHNLRKESKNEEMFIQQLTDTYNLPVEISRWKKQPSKKDFNENSARQARHKFFTQIAKKNKTQKIVLAHNKDDVAETVLMRIIRGSGTNGLQGILPVKQIDSLEIIRPLLHTSRAEIEKIVKKQKLSYKNDATNQSPIFTRNKIRLDLLPKLKKEYNPNISENLIHLSQSTQTDYNYIHKEAQKIFNKTAQINQAQTRITFKISILQKQDPAILRMLLKSALTLVTPNTKLITFKHICTIETLIKDSRKTAKLELSSNLSISKNTESLIFRKK